jgi:hypothetical protein
VRILFDQGTPVPLRHALVGHEVATVYEQGWSALPDGPLLAAAERAGFEVFVTSDRQLRHQLPLARYRLAILVLGSTSWPRGATANSRSRRLPSEAGAATLAGPRARLGHQFAAGPRVRHVEMQSAKLRRRRAARGSRREGGQARGAGRRAGPRGEPGGQAGDVQPVSTTQLIREEPAALRGCASAPLPVVSDQSALTSLAPQPRCAPESPQGRQLFLHSPASKGGPVERAARPGADRGATAARCPFRDELVA